MNVLVDTSIWSLAFRRGIKQDSHVVNKLTELIKEHRVCMIGPVRQEILSGIKTENQFQELKQYLAAFPDLPAETSDYEKAAEFYNICRKNGVQGSNTDFLICAIAFHHDMEIFTSDKDFLDFQKNIPVKLHNIKK
jgi:predicted nucleic acid-binding protein